MRGALLIAAGSIICLTQAALASTFGEPLYYVKLSKPDTSYSSFMFDRQDCLQATSRKVREHYVEVKGERYFGVNLQYNLGPFVECMKARGYAIDRDGYRAIGYQVDSDGVLWGVPMGEWH
jgi:hypothetical protein